MPSGIDSQYEPDEGLVETLSEALLFEQANLKTDAFHKKLAASLLVVLSPTAAAQGEQFGYWVERLAQVFREAQIDGIGRAGGSMEGASGGNKIKLPVEDERWERPFDALGSLFDRKLTVYDRARDDGSQRADSLGAMLTRLLSKGKSGGGEGERKTGAPNKVLAPKAPGRVEKKKKKTGTGRREERASARMGERQENRDNQTLLAAMVSRMGTKDGGAGTEAEDEEAEDKYAW